MLAAKSGHRHVNLFATFFLTGIQVNCHDDATCKRCCFFARLNLRQGQSIRTLWIIAACEENSRKLLTRKGGIWLRDSPGIGTGCTHFRRPLPRDTACAEAARNAVGQLSVVRMRYLKRVEARKKAVLESWTSGTLPDDGHGG